MVKKNVIYKRRKECSRRRLRMHIRTCKGMTLIHKETHVGDQYLARKKRPWRMVSSIGYIFFGGKNTAPQSLFPT